MKYFLNITVILKEIYRKPYSMEWYILMYVAKVNACFAYVIGGFSTLAESRNRVETHLAKRDMNRQELALYRVGT